MCVSYVIRESCHVNSLDTMFIYLDPHSPMRKLRYSSLNKEGGGPQEGTLHFCGRRQVLLHAY